MNYCYSKRYSRRNRTVKKIKEFFAGLFVFALFIGAMLLGGYMDSTRTMKGNIVAVEEDCITIKDAVGNFWDYEQNNKTASLKKGDSVRITLNMNCTEHRISDDYVIGVKKIK